MTSDQPKVSFIPKSTLVRDESFLERPRPRSLLGFLAVVSLFASVGAFAGLTIYKHSLEKSSGDLVEQVKSAQSEFTGSPVTEKAKLFQQRAELAQELLNTHTVVSPVFAFLGQHTVATIFYSSFSFKGSEAGFTVELAGEAPSYASLANQAAELGKQADSLSEFSLSNLSLTKFGSIAFNLKLVFKPDYLSYIVQQKKGNTQLAPMSVANTASVTPIVATTSVTITKKAAPAAAATSTTKTIILPFIPSFSTSTATSSPRSEASEPLAVTVPMQETESVPPPVVNTAPEVAPAQNSFWGWFKFW